MTETVDGYSEEMRKNRLVFYEDDIDVVNGILTEFLDAAQAKAVLLIDLEGHLVTKRGFTKTFDSTSIAALVAGSFASTREVARQLGEPEFSVLFHQGKNEHIHISCLQERALLVIIFDDRTTIGMVRLYASELTEKIGTVLSEADVKNEGRGEPGVDSEFVDKAQDALDTFFDE